MEGDFDPEEYDTDFAREICDDFCKWLHEWNNNNHLALSFVDVHEFTQSRDETLNCNIKKNLRARLNISKTFVLIVGEHTLSVTSGACFHCTYYRKYITIPAFCSKGYCVDNRSFIQYECEMAAKDYDSGLLKNIVVIYNGLTSPDKSKCPEVLKNKGVHIGSDIVENGTHKWAYSRIKEAICK